MSISRALAIVVAAAFVPTLAARPAVAGTCDSLTALAVAQGTVTLAQEVAAGAFTLMAAIVLAFKAFVIWFNDEPTVRG